MLTSTLALDSNLGVSWANMVACSSTYCHTSTFITLFRSITMLFGTDNISQKFSKDLWHSNWMWEIFIRVSTRLKSWSFLGQHDCLQFNLVSHVQIVTLFKSIIMLFGTDNISQNIPKDFQHSNWMWEIIIQVGTRLKSWVSWTNAVACNSTYCHTYTFIMLFRFINMFYETDIMSQNIP